MDSLVFTVSHKHISVIYTVNLLHLKFTVMTYSLVFRKQGKVPAFKGQEFTSQNMTSIAKYRPALKALKKQSPSEISRIPSKNIIYLSRGHGGGER